MNPSLHNAIRGAVALSRQLLVDQAIGPVAWGNWSTLGRKCDVRRKTGGEAGIRTPGTGLPRTTV